MRTQFIIKQLGAILFLGIFASCGNTEVKTDDSEENQTQPDPNLTITNDNTDPVISIDSTSVTLNTEDPVNTTIVETETQSNTTTTITTDINTKTNTTKEGTKINTEVTKTITEVKEKIAEFNHDIFDGLLRKYVTTSGKVNYKGFKSEKAKLEEYIGELQTAYKDLSSWSKNRQLAYWINVYNSHTIKLILDNYPTSSIKNINGGKPWDKMFISLGGNSYSLNNVENDIIRKKYNESRIHFAVNCAAVSCPKLMNQAFTESNLNRKLSQMTKEFLANSSKNQLGKESIKISKIFEWYQGDFTKTGNIIPFIQEYGDEDVNDDAKVTYNEYNWDLNE